MATGAWPELNDETRDVWNANASHWDDAMQEGNSFHRQLVGPAAERLLALEPGERVIELACGNGQFARRMAELGATVLATDLAAEQIAHAERRTAARTELEDRIRFLVLDATDTAALANVGGAPFDAAVCNMGLMDMAEIDALLTAIPVLVKRGGRFVFTLSHPCFNQPGARLVLEEEDRDGALTVQPSVKVVTYKGTGARRGLAVEGQPRPQWYFTRTLSDLFSGCFEAGLMIDGLEEPAFPPDQTPSRLFGWSAFPEIPPVLAVRLRVL